MTSKAYRDLFRGTAWYYARYRPEYPEEVFNYLKRQFGLDGRGRLLDLGCGTGQLAIPLAKYFQEVVAVDPESEMLVVGKRAVKEKGVSNIQWLEGSSDDLADMGGQLGRFWLVTMGASFHWMNREETLQQLDQLVLPGGGLALLGSGSVWTDQSEKWQQVIKDTIREYLGEPRRAGSGTYKPPVGRHEEILNRSAFNSVKRTTFSYQVKWDVESLVGYVFSLSYASVYVLGDTRVAFEEDLRSRLAGFDSEVLVETVEVEVIVARRAEVDQGALNDEELLRRGIH